MVKLVKAINKMDLQFATHLSAFQEDISCMALSHPS